MKESADYIDPKIKELISQITYKPGWSIYCAHEVAEDGSGGWHLFIISSTENSLKPHELIRVRHGFLVPAATYNRNTWASWIFDRYRDVETHEAAEFYRIDDIREFAPHHGNGEDPYIVWHIGDLETALKRAGDD